MNDRNTVDNGGVHRQPVADTMGAVTRSGGAPQAGSEESGKKVALLVYILQAVALLFGITSLVGLIINYVKRADVKGTWVESHFRWQIRTFWFGVLWTIIGFVLMAVYIGVFVLLATLVWYIYRIVKGWLNLNDNRPMFL